VKNPLVSAAPTAAMFTVDVVVGTAATTATVFFVGVTVATGAAFCIVAAFMTGAGVVPI